MSSEPPVFLNIFSGGLVIHQGKRGGTPTLSPKMYLVRGETEKEAHLVAVDINIDHLRSRGCLLLVNTKSCVIYLWSGCKAMKHTRNVANKAAKLLAESTSSAIDWNSKLIPRIKEQFEGTETKDFWECFKDNRALSCRDYTHHSLLNDANTTYDWTPRVWRLEAKYNCFEANELTCSYRLPDVANPLPFLQEQFYNVPQPGNYKCAINISLYEMF